MKKYKASYGFRESIEKVNIIKETEHFVTVEHTGYNGTKYNRREKKITGYYAYFDTFNKAKEFLIKDSEEKLNSIRLSWQKEQGRLGNIKGIKNTEEKK